MIEFSTVEEKFKIDHCHADLISGLVKAQKPQNILEIGFGGGRSCKAIILAAKDNQNNPQYTLVDNWLDFGRTQPPGLPVSGDGINVQIITSEECDFIRGCRQKYDFIMSDADHQHTNEWFMDVYNNLLNDDGILIYHDISIRYTNLITILDKCKELKFSHMLFNNNSKAGENCERGLLVIFKSNGAPKDPGFR